ncbi:MAG: replicative DNA helicase [Candidatus Cloacimonetes bacterium]|nr:replicative DNA helicase [Candidatus Cloacimonadota bacterium]
MNIESKTNMRLLPQEPNAEAAVLSAMLIDGFAVAKVIELLEEKHFYKKQHRLIFRCMRQLFVENTEIDIITVIDRLNRENILEEIGGTTYLNELIDIVMSGSNVEYHANIVLEKALLRELIQTSNIIIESAYNSDLPVKEIVDNAEQMIFKIAERPNHKSFIKISDILVETLNSIEKIATTKTVVNGVRTGFDDLDRITGGFRPGQFIVLAARPAMGKTAFALNIAFNASMYQNLKVAIFTMEMENEEILLRIISSASEVNMDVLHKGYGMDEQKLIRIAQVAEALNDKDIYIDDMGSNTLLDVRAKSRRLQAKIGGLDLIIIDYLQLMSSGFRADNRQQEISDISRSLKVLAKELGCPIIGLSQLNRSLENRDDKRPKLADLRESGAIEQDADMVMFIYRDDYYNKESDKEGMAEVIIGKNRHGPTATIELVFIKPLTQFRSKSYEVSHVEE